MDLCEELVQRPGTWVSKQLREQERLYLEGARAAAPEDVKGKPENAEGEVGKLIGN